jgi:type I restriction enzyme S subunit
MRNGWTETTLGEVVVINPEAAKGMEDDDDIIYIDISSVSAESGISSDLYRGSFGEAPGRARRVIRTQDVLVSTVRPYLKGFALVPNFLDGEIASTGFAVLRAKPTRILPGLVWAIVCMNNFVDYLMDRATGSSYPAVRPEDISSFSFCLPPLDEQKRIVDVVSSVDVYIDSLQQQADTARTARNAVLHELLSAGGDDWTESTLGEIVILEYGKPLKAENRDGKGFPVFGSAGEVGLHSEPLVNESPVIVVGRKGTAGAVWWSDLPCSVIDTAYYVVRKFETDIRFLYFILGYLDLPSLTAQTGVPGLNRDRAYSSRVLLPLLDEQRRIVEIVSSMDDVIQSTERAVIDAKNLRSGLLSDLLSGDHEIPASYDSLLGAA